MREVGGFFSEVSLILFSDKQLLQIFLSLKKYHYEQVFKFCCVDTTFILQAEEVITTAELFVIVSFSLRSII